MKLVELKKKDIGWIFIFLGIAFALSGYIKLITGFFVVILGIIIILNK
ncbi:MAG: hypothetical protein PHG24_02745 [Candidatus Pacebacteria bacterium]|nr:hypothetical protein [Candidatus Paceibacterota bacterium]